MSYFNKCVNSRWACALALVAAAIVFSEEAKGHEYWLLPEPFNPTVGTDVPIHLFMGEALRPEEERGFDAKRIVRFDDVTERWTKNLMYQAVDGSRPLFSLPMKTSVAHLIRLDRSAVVVELPAEKFTSYLHEEGLDVIVRERERLGESQRVGREKYTRYLKSLISPRAVRSGVSERILGQRLEIVPVNMLENVAIGNTLSVRVFFLGAPLANAPLFLTHLVGTEVVSRRATTDALGMARFQINESGVGLLHLVHMRRCEGCGDAEWESFWASYSFATSQDNVTR